VYASRLGLIVSIGLSFSAAGCLTSGETRAGDGRDRTVHVETARLQRMTVERRVEVSGTLVSPDQARVSSEVAGIVRDVNIELGSEVQAGSVLVRLEPRELTLALERAESARRQIEAQLGIEGDHEGAAPSDDEIASVQQAAAGRDDARATFARAEELHLRGLVSKVDRDSADTRRKIADANYQAAVDAARSLRASLQDRRAAHELAQKALADAVVRAPVAGAVAERNVQRGEFIPRNTPIVTIVQLDPLKLRTAIQEKHAGLITRGQTVEFVVEAFPDAVFNGEVAFVSPVADEDTRAFRVEILVDNADRRLKPGFFAKGTVLTKIDDQVLAAPAAAVSTLAGVSTVQIIEDGKVRQQQIALGVHQDGLLEVVEGLEGEELLAASNLNQLATGTSVRTDR
jgi:RND family efflux transporter MFP subunit